MADNLVASLRSSAEWIKEMEHESWLGTAELQIEAADAIQQRDDEIVRLKAEVERIEGQRKLRADMAYLFKAERNDERALANQLADALKMVLHDRPSAHTDNVWSVINHALNTYEGVRHEW